MTRRVVLFAALFFLTTEYGASLAADKSAPERGSPNEAVAMVGKVITSLKAKGREKTIDDVNRGIYIDRDLYIVILDLEGRNVGASKNHKMLGKSLLDARDQDGKYFVREAIDIAKTKGKGWITYKWPDPYTKTIAPKYMYLEVYDDLMISCGVFKDPSRQE